MVRIYRGSVTGKTIARTFRFSAKQNQQLRKLCDKLGLDMASVVRLAIARLAELEGIK